MREISQLTSSLKQRPLLICDIDEVVLEFLTPFRNFLNDQQFDLRSDSFALHGNVVRLEEKIAVKNQIVDELIEDFYSSQDKWQFPVKHVCFSLKRLAAHLDIIFLTAMPPHHFVRRKELLERYEMPYPLLASEDAKGPLIKQLHGNREHQIFFVDDMVYNLRSAADHAPQTKQITIMANQEFRAISPPVDEHVFVADTWPDIENYILSEI